MGYRTGRRLSPAGSESEDLLSAWGLTVPKVGVRVIQPQRVQPLVKLWESLALPGAVGLRLLECHTVHGDVSKVLSVHPRTKPSLVHCLQRWRRACSGLNTLTVGTNGNLRRVQVKRVHHHASCTVTIRPVLTRPAIADRP